jgi:hypothetical protein
MVTVVRSLAAAVLGIGAAVGLAVPAAADQPVEGSYTYSEAGLPSANWTFSPTCVPAGMTKTPFTLAFLGPLDAPVTRYPLQCDQFGVYR